MNQNSQLNNAQSTSTYRKFSFIRLSFLILVIVAIFFSSFHGYQYINANQEAGKIAPWFASYVDVTATPTFAFEEIGANKDNNQAVLSFIVSSLDDSCKPSWGASYSLDQAGDSLDLDRRIARLRQQGGDIAVSFGGLINDELAVKCEDEDKLYQAYLAVINRYKINTIDLDLESGGLKDVTAANRRARVLTKLQSDIRDRGENLAIWLTLPVTTQGLAEQGTKMVDLVLASGLDISGVNAMTMNFGDTLVENQSSGDGSISSLAQTHRQLGILYEKNSIFLNDSTLWKKIGATPMIGQNDIEKEVFTLEDAKVLNNFAKDKGLARMSMWSANRDRICGGNYIDLKKVSDSCSGIIQDLNDFNVILSNNFTANISANASAVTENDETTESTVIVDDPLTTPYQIWSEDGRYLQGTKVVWHGNVYEAKWWTQNNLPDDPVLQTWETPWKLIGPVLPGEEPIKQPTLPDGIYPQWSGMEVYEAGSRVLFDKTPFQSKWWTQGDSPAAASSNADSSPWVPLTQAEINKIIDQQ